MKWKLFHVSKFNMYKYNHSNYLDSFVYPVQYPRLKTFSHLVHYCISGTQVPRTKRGNFFLRKWMNKYQCILCHRQNGFMLIKEGKRNWVWRMKEWISAEYSCMLLQRQRSYFMHWIENWKVFLLFSNLPSWNLTKTVI